MAAQYFAPGNRGLQPVELHLINQGERMHKRAILLFLAIAIVSSVFIFGFSPQALADTEPPEILTFDISWQYSFNQWWDPELYVQLSCDEPVKYKYWYSINGGPP